MTDEAPSIAEPRVEPPDASVPVRIAGDPPHLRYLAINGSASLRAPGASTPPPATRRGPLVFPEQDLPFGSALGDFDGHPWAAERGIDHRQLLVDLTL